VTFKYKYLELIIENELIHEFAEIGMKHYPNEFGGFLIGNYSSDFKKLYISDYILPRKYKGSPFSFLRHIDGLLSVFNKIFKEKNLYYIGEWHTHPNGSTMYSQTDLNAMIETVKCDTVKIKNPVLLIMSIGKKDINGYAFYYLNDEKLIPYE
jgi:[CysO sulfur-carrier protein]-S-L-cysteine hydrolase